MEKTIIIAANLGRFVAYRLSRDLLGSAGIEQIAADDFEESLEKITDLYSDNLGRFRQAGGDLQGTDSFGEPHNIEDEQKRRVVKLIAQEINELIRGEGMPQWYFAAHSSINRRIVKELGSDVKSRLLKNIEADLTKIKDKSELVSHFN